VAGGHALAELPQVALEVPDQLMSWVLAEGARDLGAADRRQRRGGPWSVPPQTGLDGAEARQPGRLAQCREPAGAEVDRVELDRERRSRLIAGACKVGSGRRFGGQRPRIGSIAAATIRTCWARAATRAAPARMSSVSATERGSLTQPRAAPPGAARGRRSAVYRESSGCLPMLLWTRCWKG
jgi:hypothetical protein